MSEHDDLYAVVNTMAVELPRMASYEDVVRAATGNWTEPVDSGFTVTYRHRDATRTIGMGATLVPGGKHVHLLADYATIFTVVRTGAA